jgi:hypothetical protein
MTDARRRAARAELLLSQHQSLADPTPALCDSKSHFNRLKRVYSGCKRIKFKKSKTSSGPVAAMAARRPGGGRRLKRRCKEVPSWHTQSRSSNVFCFRYVSGLLFSSRHLEGCLMVYTTPKVVYTTLGIYHGNNNDGIYKRGRWYIPWYIP